MGFFDNLAEKAKQKAEEAERATKEAERAVEEDAKRAAEEGDAKRKELEIKLYGKTTEQKKAEEEALKAEKEAAKEKIKGMILTTLDIKQDYEIIGIVISQEIWVDEKLDYETGMSSLKIRAAELGADAVVGVRCFFCNNDGRITNSGNRRWYGTAVKFK